MGASSFLTVFQNQFLALFDLSNPFSIYFWVLVIGFVFRFVLVLRPLHGIYKQYRNPGYLKIWKIPIPFTGPGGKWNSRKKVSETIHKANEVKKETSITGIEDFLLHETMMALAPTLCAGVLRILLGSPTIAEWTPTQMYLLFGVFAVWLTYYIRRSLEMRKGLKNLNRWYADPRIVNTALGGLSLTKRGLVRLTKLEIPEYREEEDMELMQMRHENEDGKKTLDRQAIVHNAKEIGSAIAIKTINFGIAAKSATKSFGEKGSTKLDETVQGKVDEALELDTNRVWNFVKSLMVVFGPLVVIYLLPYSIEQIIDSLVVW
jgi:hypothetical protein